jgi:catechol 2,3-dioxygenase-like lactoylglutathione lyase family enzyme
MKVTRPGQLRSLAACPRCSADVASAGEIGAKGLHVINRHMYVLAVPNLARSSAFYRDVLGFDIRELGPGWLLYVKDACQIMAGECPDAIPARELGDHSYFGYLVVDNADEYYRCVTAANVEIGKTLRDEPWGMGEFGLRTADGHRIMIGSERTDAGPGRGRTRG